MKKKTSKRKSATPAAQRTVKRDRFNPMGSGSNAKPKTSRYADGGMIRGCGAATKGKRYTRSA